nr:mucin-2-like [Penaeus vannamei]
MSGQRQAPWDFSAEWHSVQTLRDQLEQECQALAMVSVDILLRATKGWEMKSSSSTWPAIYLYLLAIVHLLLIPPLPPTCAPPAPSTLLPSTVTYTSTYTLAPLHLCIHAPATYTCLHSTNLLHLHLPATVHGSTFLEPASTSPPPRCTSTCLAPPPALHGPSSLSRTCHLNHPLSTSRSTSCTLPPPRLALLPPPRHAPPTPPRQHASCTARSRSWLGNSSSTCQRSCPATSCTSTSLLTSPGLYSSLHLATSTATAPALTRTSNQRYVQPPRPPRLSPLLIPSSTLAPRTYTSPSSTSCYRRTWPASRSAPPGHLPHHLHALLCHLHLHSTPPACHPYLQLLPPSATSTLTHLQLFHLQPSTPRSSAPPACTCAPRTTFQPLLLIAPPTLLLQALNASAPRCTSTSCNLYLTLPLPPLSPPCSTSTCTPPPPCAPAPLLTSLHISSTSALLYSTSTRPARPPAACHHHGSPLAIPPSWQPALSTSSNLQLARRRLPQEPGEGCVARVRTVTLVIVRGIGSLRARDFTSLLIGGEPTRDLGRPYRVMKLAPRPW